MFGVKNVCVGERIYAAGTHFVLSEGFISPKMVIDSIPQYEVTFPLGYTVVSYSRLLGFLPDLLFVNTVPVRTKVYKKKNKKICPDFGTPLNPVFNEENVCDGEKFYNRGTHFVVSGGGFSQSMLFGDRTCREVCPPDGYTAVTYFQMERFGPEILYVNTVPVKAKVYQKKKKDFCPDFGTPVTTNRHR